MDRRTTVLLWVGLAVAALLMLAWPSSPRVIEGPDYPPELAEAVRDSVEMIRDAREDAQSYTVWSGRWRMLAIVIGVSVPVVVAYLLFRSATKTDPDEIEVVARLADRSSDLFLPQPDREKLPEPSEEGGHSDDEGR